MVADAGHSRQVMVNITDLRPVRLNGGRTVAGRVDGRCVVITGAGSGMGRGFAMAFAREGAYVGVLDRDATAAGRVRSDIEAEGGSALALSADVSDREQVSAALDAFVARAGR